MLLASWDIVTLGWVLLAWRPLSWRCSWQGVSKGVCGSQQAAKGEARALGTERGQPLAPAEC